MVVDKLKAAKIQLDTAIEHFFNSNHVCSVTLAGAAEDIFRDLSTKAGHEELFE